MKGKLCRGVDVEKTRRVSHCHICHATDTPTRKYFIIEKEVQKIGTRSWQSF